MNKLFAIAIGSFLLLGGLFLMPTESEQGTGYSLQPDRIPLQLNDVDSIPHQPQSELPFCGQETSWEQMLRQHQDLEKQHISWEKNMKKRALQRADSPLSRSLPPPYTLPIVVHVIHDNGAENISLTQIQQGIQHLNDAFANRGYYDQGTGVDTRIQFCLAIQDPNSNSTNGINRVQSILTEMNKETQDLDVKNLMRWDPKQYINIWLVREICSTGSSGCGVAGYAYFPSAHGRDFDGIMMEARWFGSGEGASGVTIHEMGHYLGLYHTFQGGCMNNDCLRDGDRVCDTPPDQSTARVPCTGNVNSCTTDVNPSDPNNPFTVDQNDMFINYMDYGDFNCYSALTDGQTVRMHDAIETQRRSLLNSLACTTPCSQSITAGFTVLSDTVTLGTTVTFTNTSTGGTIYTWTIDGTAFPGGSYAFNSLGTFEVVITGTNNDPNCRDTFAMDITVICGAQASFTVDSVQIRVGSVLNFANTSTGATSYTWTVNSGMPTTTNDFTFFSSTAGIFDVCLTADNGSCQTEVCRRIFVRAIPGSSDEICGNGLDDDGDGLIDCYDPDCCDDPVCEDNYYKDCPIGACPTDSVHQDFRMQLEWETTSSHTLTGNDVIVGDIDNDGMPEVLQVQYVNRRLALTNGRDGTIEWEISVPQAGRAAIADIDRDGTAEIFVGDNIVSRVEHDGTVTATMAIPNFSAGWHQPKINLADFNQDGKTELFTMNRVYDAETMTFLAEVPLRFGQRQVDVGLGVAVDVIPASPACPDCDGLEYVVGPYVYSINALTFQFTLIHSVILPSANGPTTRNTTSIADIDGDGDLDAVVVGRVVSDNQLYSWDIQTPTVMGEIRTGSFTIPPLPQEEFNIPAIADLNGDGLPEIICQTNRLYLTAYAPDLQTALWHSSAADASANATQTVFDLNADGKPEVLFRGSSSMYIVNGQDGSIMEELPCRSATSSEMPVIVDIDADGEAEIACECDQHLHVFGSAGKPWANTRQVWNQYTYFNVNINDDLTIPMVQQEHHLVGDRVVMNAFLKQTVIYPDDDCSEICDNGIDDDGDGLIDCYDPDCCEELICEDFYFDACPEPPECPLDIIDTIELATSWSNQNVNDFSMVTVGDVDGDGKPDVVVKGDRNNSGILVLGGVDGNTKYRYDESTAGYHCIGDIDNDGMAEIIFISIASSSMAQLTRLDFNPLTSQLEFTWLSNTAIGGPGSLPGIFFRPGLADFNEDGIPEVYVGNKIYNTQTGIELAAGGSNNIGAANVGAASTITVNSVVAMDVLPDGACSDCDGLEMIAGNQIYAVDLVSQTDASLNSMPVVRELPGFLDGATGIADFDEDGDLDVIFAQNVNLLNRILNQLIVWDPITEQVIGQPATFVNGPFSHSVPAVGDVDGDGHPEIVINTDQTLVVLEDYTNGGGVNWGNSPNTIKASLNVGDHGGLTPSLFDFNGDGKLEIVFTNQRGLQIFDENLNLLSFWAAHLFTQDEAPVIVDIDQDQEAEIIAIGEFDGNNNSITAFESVNFKWSDTREIWNQYSFFNTHINDDGTIPAIQQQQQRAGDGLVLNTYMMAYATPREQNCPEICDNQLDDDGDGLIDCLDPDCCDSIICIDQPTPCDTCIFIGNLDLGPDVTVCDNGIYNFNAGSSFTSYRWSDQTTDSTFTSDSPGKFWVEVTDSCGNTYSDTVVVSVIAQSRVDLGPDETICLGDSVTLTTGVFDHYQWFSEISLPCDTCQDITVKPDATTRYIVLASSDLGCYTLDTIDVFVDTMPISYDTLQICQGDTIILFGQLVYEDRTISVNLVSSGACDSVAQVTVVVRDTIVTSETLEVCAGDTIQVFGQNIFTNSFLAQTLPSASGCDSTHEVTVILLDTVVTREQIEICEGDTIQVFGHNIFQDAILEQTSTAVNGCDSIHRVTISVLDSAMVREAIQICAGDTILIFGQSVFETARLEQTSTGSNGCDSTHIVTVSLKDTIFTSEVIELCKGDSITIFGQIIFRDTFLQQTSSGVNFCDSTHLIQVLFLDTILTFKQIDTCLGSEVLVWGVLVESDTIMERSFSAVNGCDSIHTVSLSFQPDVLVVNTVKICPGESVEFRGDTLWAEGIYDETTTPLGGGCDTIHRLVVRFYSPAITYIITRGCPDENDGRLTITNPGVDESFSMDGVNYQNDPRFRNLTPGTYTLNKIDAYGCLTETIVTIEEQEFTETLLTSDTMLMQPDTFIMPVSYSDTATYSFEWTPSEGLSCSTCPYPTVYANFPQTYQLIVRNTKGCLDTRSIFIHFEQDEPNVYIPNIFSPNGDNINDVFTVFGNQRVEKVELLQIFNRWGDLVFSDEDFPPNDPLQGWDGTFKGKVLNPAVFVYQCRVLLDNGQRVFFAGDVTLVK